jgi:2'-5' RNA ligase
VTPLYAVVSLLDPPRYRQVEALWTELKSCCGIEGIYKTPFPHFSYHVAAGYDLPQLEATLRRFARTWSPFRVHTTGLGIFTGPNPVVYVPVVRGPLVADLHRKLWAAANKVSTGALEYYRPERWMPHITLGHGDITAQNLPGVIQALAGQNLHWEIEVDNLAIISSTGSPDGLHVRVPLEG